MSLPADDLPAGVQTLFHAGRCDEALSQWRSPVAPASAVAVLQAARWLTRHGRFTAAVELVRNHSATAPVAAAHAIADAPDRALGLAAAWLEMGATDTAAALFGQIVTCHPGNILARLGLAAACPSAMPLTAVTTGTPSPALPLLETLTRGNLDNGAPDNGTLNDETVESAIGATAPDDTAPGLYWWLGWRIAGDRGREVTARACLRRAALAESGNLLRSYGFAAACLRINRIGDIAAVWSSLPIALATAAPSRLVAAAVALNGDRVVPALELARSVLAQSAPDNDGSLADAASRPATLPIAHALAGYAATMIARDVHVRERLAAFMARGDRRRMGPSRARGAYEHLAAVMATGDTAAGWNDIGHLYACLDDLPAAVDAFSRALTLDPAQRNATINLAVIRLRQNMTANLAAYLDQTVFLAALPPSLERFRDRATELPADANEWRRGTVFSYAWRRQLAELLAGGGVP